MLFDMMKTFIYDSSLMDKDKIDIENLGINSCIHNCFAIVLETIFSQHEPIFMLDWDFSFREGSIENGNFINSDVFNNCARILKDCYNITTCINRDPSSQEILSQLRKSRTENIPLLFLINPMYCDWTPFYKTESLMNHMFIVRDSLANNEVEILDMYYSRGSSLTRNLDDLILNCESVISFDISRKFSNFNFNMVRTLMDESLSKTERIVDNIELLARDIDIYKIIQAMDERSESLPTSVVITRLGFIGDSRSHHAKFLEFLLDRQLVNRSRYLTELVCDLKDISDDWKAVKLHLVKSIIRKKYNNEELRERILEISRKEKSSLLKLKGIVSDW
jgi:hypothetical protein